MTEKTNQTNLKQTSNKPQTNLKQLAQQMAKHVGSFEDIKAFQKTADAIFY